MATTTIEYADRISELPDHIIHHILSFLLTADVVLVSSLSKSWYRVFTCFPISNFSEPSFPATACDRKLNFANFVYSSLLRQSQDRTSIPKFQLSSTGNSYHNFLNSQLQNKYTSLINRSIGLLSRQYGTVKELSLHLGGSVLYRLPEAIFSAEELVVCSLSGCKLKDTINFPSLREIYLRSVHIFDKRIINNLCFTCPFIEKFALINCSGLHYLKLSGLTKLKKVEVDEAITMNVVGNIEIDALSLQSFSYSGAEFRPLFDRTFIDLTSCKNLEVYKLRHNYVGERVIQKVISNFPALKVLVLQKCSIERIEILCQQLEILQLSTESKAESIIINTPRLQSFKYEFTRLPYLFSINKSSSLEVSLELYLEDLFFNHLTDWLEYCTEFPRNFYKIKLVTLNISNRACTTMSQSFSEVSCPGLININHLKLKFRWPHANKEKDYKALVDILFLMCHPESLVLVSGWDMSIGFMEVLCKELINRMKDEYCCANSKVKCWRHDLKGFKIEHRRKNGDRKVLECDALFKSLQTLAPDEKICFVFEWLFIAYLLLLVLPPYVCCEQKTEVATPLMCKAFGMGVEEVEKTFEATSCLKGVLKLKHEPNAVLFPASEDSEFITGHNLVVDGGFKSLASSQFNS